MELFQYMMCDIFYEECLRECMMEYGVGVLSYVELLVILFWIGMRQELVVYMVQCIFIEVGGICLLMDMSLNELIVMKGIGMVKVVQFKVGIEFGYWIVQSRWVQFFLICIFCDVVDILFEQLCYLQKEYFVCFFLNSKNYIIVQEIFFMGSFNVLIVYLCEVFCVVIKCSSVLIVCVYNYLSGDFMFSFEDI